MLYLILFLVGICSFAVGIDVGVRIGPRLLAMERARDEDPEILFSLRPFFNMPRQRFSLRQVIRDSWREWLIVVAAVVFVGLVQGLVDPH